MINSLARGLQILQLLAAAPGPLGVTEVGERLEVDPSTSYRLLATLEKHGFVRQEASKKYALSFGILEISSALVGRLDVASISTTILRDLADTTGESTHLAVADRTLAVFVAQAPAGGILRVTTAVGSSEPLYCTAVGKALMIDMSAAEVARLLQSSPLERHTPQTITSVELLVVELERARARDYAFDDEEYHAGVRCIAAPIRDHAGAVVAALGLSAPASRLTRDRVAEFASATRKAATDVSQRLGASVDNAVAAF